MKYFIIVPVVIVLALVVSFLSGRLVTGHDFSQEATAGEIQLHGFPIWFLETAPGFSIVDGWHFARLLYNTLCWVGVFAVVGVSSTQFLRK
jgi:hypothetical protein